MNALTVKNLIKTYKTKSGKIKAVDNISFSVKKGEIFGLLGVNGAGKSTTISILTGLQHADSGEVKIFGKDYKKHEEEIKLRSNVATAYYTLSFNLTVKQNLQVYARLYNVKNRNEKIAELLEKFMMTKHLNSRVRALSSGEKTRLSLIKSLLNDPELLFLDECTVGLDPDMAEVTRDLLQQHNKETGCTIIFTSHYMQEVERLCDRIAFMDEGKIVKIGTSKDLLKELEFQKIHLHFSHGIRKAKELLNKENIKFAEHKGILTFQLKNEQKLLYNILEKFTKANIPFDDIQLDKPTLEDYFLKRARS
jgi:ABC-2 type transport system ATP-binding protein